MNQSKFPIYLTGDRIFSNSGKAIELQNSKNLGEKIQGKVIYSIFEALYLVETGKSEIFNIKTNKRLKEEQILNAFSKHSKEFQVQYAVFKKLRQKGYVVKTGSKFGSEFRVYDNSMNKHAKWLIYPVKQSEKSNWNDFISKNRIAHGAGKKILLAIVDSEENVIFYEIDWIKI
ncbi:tRNA-splicing endonuclease [uncultured archaeon]|nr:tRNA-splicing endonuclease [uncultured archaeon]